MRKFRLLVSQSLVILIACSCVVGGLLPQSQPEESNADLPASDFEMWEQGVLPQIQLTSGQESLTNFREQFRMQITGTAEDGAPFDGYDEYLREIDRSADSTREFETLKLPSTYLSGVREWVVADGYTYLVSDALQGGRDCEKTENPADDSHISDVHVTRILLTITPGDLIEEDVQVQGVQADVYEIENLSLLFVRELSSVSGKVWIAREPRYFLKAEGDIEGIFEFENRQYNGAATFTYEIRDFDQVQVELPVLCAYPPEDEIPMPSNAREEVEYPGMITFSSPDSVDQVMDFYLTELAAQGWQVEEPSSDSFNRSVKAGITTQQGIRISIEVKVIAMSAGSSVQIGWQVQ